MIVLAHQVARDGEPGPRRNRRPGVRCTERIVFALRPLGETGQPVLLAQRPDAVAPPGQDLVRIGLVPDIPDQAVIRRVEHGMDRHGQLDHAKPGPKMPARHRNRADRFLAQLIGDLLQILSRSPAQVRRN